MILRVRRRQRAKRQPSPQTSTRSVAIGWKVGLTRLPKGVRAPGVFGFLSARISRSSSIPLAGSGCQSVLDVAVRTLAEGRP